MAQMAAHLVEQVIPWVPTRQWVVSVPIPLRYWMAPSRDLTVQIHTIIRRTIGQYYVNQAVKQGATRARVQRLGDVFAALWRLHQSQFTLPHDFFEGVYKDRRVQGLKPFQGAFPNLFVLDLIVIRLRIVPHTTRQPSVSGWRTSI